MNLDLKDKELIILQEILSKYPYEFYVFGSRIKGKAEKFSDLDLAYKEDIAIQDLSDLREKLEESDLPFHVDLINLNEVSNDFAELVRRDMQLFPKS